MYKNNEEQPIYMKSRVTALLEDLLFYFTSGEKVEQGRGGRERIQRASDYILQHCREEITLEDLADHLYLSRAYISRSFPQYFGVSFREYVTQVRLAHAVQEMHSGATLTEIAYHNGFVNETAMIRAFRKYRGMTPSKERMSSFSVESTPTVTAFAANSSVVPFQRAASGRAEQSAS